MTPLPQDWAARSIEQAVVDRLQARHGWSLLRRDEFIQRTKERFQTDPSYDATRAAMWVYSEALYAACSGAEGDARREQGYHEVHYWLYTIAHQRYRDVAEDATQQALLRVYTGFRRCRQAGTFLMFALLQLREAARQLRRQLSRCESLDQLRAVAGGLSERIADTAPAPDDRALAGELQSRIEQLHGTFLRKHPRAGVQVAAVWMKYVVGLDDQEMARQLGKSLNQVYVLRSRGLRKLATDPAWRAVAAELGIARDDQ